MDAILICLIVAIIGYCVINQIEVNELYAELEDTHKDFTKLDKYECKLWLATNTLDELEEKHKVLKDEVSKITYHTHICKCDSIQEYCSAVGIKHWSRNIDCFKRVNKDWKDEVNDITDAIADATRKLNPTKEII